MRDLYNCTNTSLVLHLMALLSMSIIEFTILYALAYCFLFSILYFIISFSLCDVSMGVITHGVVTLSVSVAVMYTLAFVCIK